MDPMVLRVFQGEIEQQLTYAIVAAHRVNAALARRDIGDVWFYIQALLIAAANVSKASWGQGGKRTEERRPIRESLGIADDSSLRETLMRNHFEHIDQRIEQWWNESPQRNYHDGGIFPLGAVHGLAEIDMFRVFDNSTSDVVFWGDKFNLSELIAEAQRVQTAARQILGT